MVRSYVQGLGCIYDEFQCSMGNGHMGTPCKQHERQTRLNTLPSQNFSGGW